jgi:hypothetical protein
MILLLSAMNASLSSLVSAQASPVSFPVIK